MIWFGFEYLKKYAFRFDFRIICNSHTLVVSNLNWKEIIALKMKYDVTMRYVKWGILVTNN